MNSILLLEDDESVNRGITFTLQKEGYTVYSCVSVKEAEQTFQSMRPQLVICDITLPDGNGLHFVRKIRSISNVHIICLTALDQETDQVMGYEAGADDYMTKPFSLSVLSLKVGAYFIKHVKEGKSLLETGDIRVSLPEMRAFAGGKEILFTKNEWKLLRLFMEHPKQILSKNQMLNQLFDAEGDFVDENTIAVNIRRLREKIEPDASRPQYIKNVRGIGYIWNKECYRI